MNYPVNDEKSVDTQIPYQSMPEPPLYNNAISCQNETITYQQLAPNPNVVYVESIQKPVYPVNTNNVIRQIYNVPIVSTQSQHMMCQPQQRYLPNINEERIYMTENFPICFVISFSLVFMLLGILQILAEICLMLEMSVYSQLGSGLICGGFNIFVSIFFLITCCIKKRAAVRMAIGFSIVMIIANIGLGIIIAALDVQNSTVADDCTYVQNCFSLTDYSYIAGADVVKMGTAGISIKMCVVFIVFMKKLINRSPLSARYTYVLSQNIPNQHQLKNDMNLPKANNEQQKVIR